MVNNHLDSERGNLHSDKQQKGPFYMYHPTHRIVYTTAFNLSWSTDCNEIYVNGSTMRDRTDDTSQQLEELRLFSEKIVWMEEMSLWT